MKFCALIFLLLALFFAVRGSYVALTDNVIIGTVVESHMKTKISARSKRNGATTKKRYSTIEFMENGEKKTIIKKHGGARYSKSHGNTKSQGNTIVLVKFLNVYVIKSYFVLIGKPIFLLMNAAIFYFVQKYPKKKKETLA